MAISSRRRPQVIGVTIGMLLVTLGGTATPARAADVTLAPVVLTTGAAMAAIPTVDMTGLTAPVTLTTSPPLPGGLSLDAGDASIVGTGILTGTPTVSSVLTTYTITATDGSTTPVVHTADLPLAVTRLTPPADITASFGQPLTGAPKAVTEGLASGVVYALTGAPVWLSISSAGALAGTPTAAQGATPVTITATDAASTTASASFVLTVLDALAPPTQSVAGVVGTALTPTTAFSSSTPGTYVITPAISAVPGLTFDAATGVISGTPGKPIAPTAFTIQLLPTGGGSALQATITVTVDGILGTSAQAVTGTVGSAITPFIGYASAAATAAGLTGPFAYSTTPILPGLATPGDLSINPTSGAISGRPTAAAVGAKYTVNVTDKNGAKASGPITLTIGGQLLPAVQSLTGSVGTTTTSRTISATGMMAPITYAISPSLPAGLNLSSSTGIVSGIPRAVQTVTTYDISAVDANGATGKASLSITVSKAVLSPPVIGAIQAGTKAGSIVVNFTAPRLAPADQTYTVQVYDSFGSELVTSLDAKSSPVTVDGLTPGDTYQVVVVANATSTFDRVESLPKTGVASAASASSTVVVAAPAAATVSGKGAKPSTASLSSQGFVLAVGSQASTAKRVLVTSSPATRKSKAPTVRLRMNTYSRIVLRGLPWKGVATIDLRAARTWIKLGSARVDAQRGLKLPAFVVRKVGTFMVRLTSPAGPPVYVKLVVRAPAAG